MTRIRISHRLGGSSPTGHCALVGLAAMAMLAGWGCGSPAIINNGNGGSVGPGPGGAAGGGGGNSPGAGGSGITITNPDAAEIRPGGGLCGDGILERAEQCDDGNTTSGDGCSKICQIENNYECPVVGQPCTNIAVCGNGKLTSDETCDDGNTVGGDGCSADCKTIEPGFQCRVPGKPCTPKCGDGIVSGSEQCDDGKTVSGDGCSATCKIEPGFKCSGTPSKCSLTVCGDGKVEGAEGCDDGNTVPFDGCSEDCQIEPDCSGTSCTSKCGDGIVLGEQCDDGNAASGDGCSKTCQIEPGWTCTQPPLGDTMAVPVIYRDFHFSATAPAPNDFENGVNGQNNASTGMVLADLDTNGKPVYANPANPGGAVHVQSVASFATWFLTSKATPPVNHATASKLTLWDNGQGGYVNRYGADGAQWNVTQIAYWCGTVGQEKKDATGKAIPCTFLTGGTDCEKMDALGYTQLKCYTDTAGTTYQALYVVAKVDGNPLFFPIDSDTFSKENMTGAQVPSVPLGMYDASGTWPWDLDAAGNKRLHNFSFTSEVRYWFKYDSTKTFKLDFVGDDDVWVFINKKLALDLGGIHTPVPGSVTLDTATAAKLGGLKSGSVYEIAVFQAERQTTCSSYKLTLSGFNAAPTSCTPTCGDGVAVADEECDCGDGTVPVPTSCTGPNSDTTYGGCSTQCKWGTFCGDGITNGPEECDDGPANGTQDGVGGCTLGCTKNHYCGDGFADTNLGEECDLGSLNGVALDANDQPSDSPDAKIHCQTDCTIPPGVVF